MNNIGFITYYCSFWLLSAKKTKQTAGIVSENTSWSDCKEVQQPKTSNLSNAASDTTFLSLLSLTPGGEQQISELNSPLRWINHRFVRNTWNSKYENMLRCPYVTIWNICLNSAPFESTKRVQLPTFLLSHKAVPRSILTQLLVPCGPSWPPMQQWGLSAWWGLVGMFTFQRGVVFNHTRSCLTARSTAWPLFISPSFRLAFST